MSKILIKGNTISSLFFINIIEFGCKVENIVWSENFYELYQNYLPKDELEEVLRLGSAVIAYFKKDYQKVLRLLELKRFNNYTFNLRGRWTLTKTYYQLEDDRIFEECQAFTQYLYREKTISNMSTKGAHNFVKIVLMLKDPNVEKERIVNFIKNCKVVSQRIWITAKLEERKY